ncbi:restriction endonuclease subunit S [Rubinisphaera sp. JC750]|uniref:restriction endonuclease subunit S n=1 Tax=Rubinisphaera sp. JC750 TaxID=2898658 RepID=UPI001F0028AE|nr:restriction endonuclease subunit S [Rubinisphaera sp. JC750]
MASDWIEIEVNSIAATERNAVVGGPFGSDLVSKDYVPVGVPVIRGQNLSIDRWVAGPYVYVSNEKADRLSANLAKPGDLVFTQRGNAVLKGGQVAIVPEGKYDRYLISQSQMKLTPDLTKVDPVFLLYVFRSHGHAEYLRNNAVVTGVPHTNLGLLRSFSFQLPSLSDQRRIADILGSLDDKIELNRRMNDTLEAMARRLFKSWFVNFDPVHAKATLRRQHPKLSNADLSRRALPNMAPEIAELFPDEFEESALGPIPKGWDACTIEDIAILDKTSVKPGNFPEEVFDHYSIPSFDDGKTPVQEPGNQIKSNKFVVTDDCVLLTKLNPRIPRVWLPTPAESRRSICSTEFLVLRPRESTTREYLFSLMASRSFFEVYETMVTGTSGSHQRVKPEYLSAMSVVKPLRDIQDTFSKQANSFYSHMERLRLEAATLVATRDKLLPKLLSGEFSLS